MSTPARPHSQEGERARQRRASEASILDAAWTLCATVGPDGASLRDVARVAGCSHPLVIRHFGAKGHLVERVADRLAAEVAAAVDDATAGHDPPFEALLAVARQRRSHVQLLIRAGVGDLKPTAFPACLGLERLLALTDASTPAGRRAGSLRARRCSYAAAALLLGWLTFEGLLVAATGLGPVEGPRRDAVIASAAEHLVAIAGRTEPPLVARRLRVSAPPVPPPTTASAPRRARDALLDAAIELFAARGPASVSVREIGRLAGVNQGLIYRHFGSKSALLAEAIEQGSSGLFPAALADSGFDIDSVVSQLHHGSVAPRLIARTLVDDIDIASVRSDFPVLGALLRAYPAVSRTSTSTGIADPRMAVATAAATVLGSAIWGAYLRGPLGLERDGGVESAVADVGRVLLALPTAPGPLSAVSRSTPRRRSTRA